MSYVLVTADFPGVTAKAREKIYECLAQEKWKKVTEPGRDIDTVWHARFEADVTEDAAIRISIADFENCSRDFCVPKLALQWGPNKPTFKNLT